MADRRQSDLLGLAALAQQGGGQPQQLQISQVGAPMTNAQKENLLAQQKRYEELLNAQMTSQQREVEQMKQNLQEKRMEAKGVDINLAPLAAYADHLNKGKSNILRGYIQSGLMPESQAQKDARLDKMQKDISKAQDKLTGREIEALKANLQAQKAGASFNAQARYLARLRGQDMADDRAKKQFNNKLTNQLIDSVDKKFRRTKAGLR